MKSDFLVIIGKTAYIANDCATAKEAVEECYVKAAADKNRERDVLVKLFDPKKDFNRFGKIMK